MLGGFPLLNAAYILLLPVVLNALSVLIFPDNAFSRGRLSYRTLAANPRLSSLYVGARGHLFRLWLFNVNDTTSSTLFAHRELQVRPEEREECLRLGNTDHECDFWVRQVFLRSDGNLMLCSSQAMKPQLGSLDGQTLLDQEEARTQIGICSQHDGLNTTAVLVDDTSNPDGLPAIYSGIRTGLSLENNLIYRPPLTRDGRELFPALRTSIYDSSWLNEPQFVGSFSVGPHVFFFFRELLPADCFNCAPGSTKGSPVSRVARICKRDLGGRQVLRQVWTSFVKARLNCSLPGFHFDQIQGVVRVDSGAQEDSSGAADTLFYGTFTAAEHTPLRASAICAFSLAQINQLFDTGLFLEQSLSGTLGVTPPNQVPQGRPGSCQQDSRQLSDEELHFAKSHLLMAESVPPIGGAPLITQPGELLTHIVADGPLKERAGDKTGQVLLFAYSPSAHSLLKVLHSVPGRGGSIVRQSMVGSPPSPSTALLLATYRLQLRESVNSMAILAGEYIYLAQHSQVSQFRLGQCSGYAQNCALCARDPYCSWSIPRRECFPKEPGHSSAVGWIAGGMMEGESVERCTKWTKAVEVRLFPGDSVHLECPGADQQVEWALDGVVLPEEDTPNRVHARGGGIVLMNATDQMRGIYACRPVARNGQNGHTLVEYSLHVNGEDCAKPKSVEQFQAVQREWCRRMEAYQSNLSKWQSLYSEGQQQGTGQCAGSQRGTADEDGERQNIGKVVR